MEDGRLWVERLRRNRVPPSDGWMGFRYALIPKLTYGFASITPDLDKLEASFQRLYRNVLSPLRVNMNIRISSTEWLQRGFKGLECLIQV
jgi:hypothetical protein